MSTAKERLEEVMKDHNLTIQNLCDELHIARHLISSVVNEQSKKISLELSDKLCKRYPEYSELWLLTGKGSKFVKNNDTTVNIDMSENKRENSGSGDYYECSDHEIIRLKLENDMMKKEIERLRDELEKVNKERSVLLAKLLNM